MTALESGSETVPALDIVTERLLWEEVKVKGKETPEVEPKALITGSNLGNNSRFGKETLNCCYCGKTGHYKRDCRKWTWHQGKAGTKHSSACECGSEHDTMLVGQALMARSESEWVVDSGATRHMINKKNIFTEVEDLEPTETVTLGDGKTLEVKSIGTVEVEMSLLDGYKRRCSLQHVLYILKLSYNLISVTRETESGKTVTFSITRYEFKNDQKQITAVATKQGNLYHLKMYSKSQECLSFTVSENKE